MKILMSAYACNPTRGSELGNGFNWPYYTALEGHEVWCLTTIKGKKDIEKYMAEHPLPNLHFKFVAVAKWVDKLYSFQMGVYLNYLIWQYEAAKVAKKLDEEYQLDLLHHVTWGNIILGTLLWKIKKPLIFGPVGGGQKAPETFKKYFYHWWKSEIVRSMTTKIFMLLQSAKKASRFASVVLVTNPATYNIAKKMGAKNIQYCLDTGLPDHFYPRSFPERTPDKVLKILWVGRLFAFKGLPLVLEALSKVKTTIPFSLTIVGDGHLGPMLPQMIRDFRLTDKVEWKGQIPWEEVKEAYLNHDVFMFCSLRDSFASQFLEAMAYGMPIITLNMHGAGKFIPDDAALKVDATVPEETLVKLARAVEWMYNHPNERVKMGRIGYSFAKTQTWPEKVADIIQNIHPELISLET